jgi:ComF family protein
LSPDNAFAVWGDSRASNHEEEGKGTGVAGAFSVYSAYRRLQSRCRRCVRCAFCSQSDSLTLEVPSSETSAWRAVVRHLRSWPPAFPDALRSPVHDVSSVLFPSPCRICGNSLLRLSRTPICEDCWNRVAPQTGLVCARCSEDLQVSAFTHVGGIESGPLDRLCQPCRLAPPPFERAVAYGGYTGTLRRLIHALKYDGILPVAERLGGLLAEAILKLEGDSKLGELLVVAVPLHAAKRKQRGFNHADLLAKAAVRELHLRRPEWKLTLAGGAIERRKATLSQAALSPHQRRANLRGVFFVPRPELVAGRNILLVDDIYTTGATARACSQVLRRAGAASVRVATVARPQRESTALLQFEHKEISMEQDVAFWGPRQAETAIAGAVPPVATAAIWKPATQQHKGFGG